MQSQSPESDNLFEVNLLFKDSKNAIEAFGQMTRVYQALNDFDKQVIRNISPNLVCEYGLEDVEFGSLKTKLRQLLKAIPDDILKELELKKAIGYFLVKIKYWLIKLLADEKEIDSSSQLQIVSDKVNDEIKLIGETHQIMVTQINNYIILNAADNITKEISGLKEKELLEYKSKAGNVYVDKGVLVNKAKILTELGQRVLTNDTTEILKIKKIDMLSDQAKWEFLQGKKHLTARMLDKQWLEEFHNRNIDIKPEDALMVTLRTTHSYAPNFEEQKTEFEVIKILSIISPGTSEQMELGG